VNFGQVTILYYIDPQHVHCTHLRTEGKCSPILPYVEGLKGTCRGVRWTQQAKEDNLSNALVWMYFVIRYTLYASCGSTVVCIWPFQVLNQTRVWVLHHCTTDSKMLLMVYVALWLVALQGSEILPCCWYCCLLLSTTLVRKLSIGCDEAIILPQNQPTEIRMLHNIRVYWTFRFYFVISSLV
jgi:hypothetical protein